MRAFVDTNLWVYRLDQREPRKSVWIREWLRELAADHEIVVSTQVMVELRSVLTRKFEPPLSAPDVRTALEVLSEFDVIGAHPDWVLDAHELAVREQLAWFDALILEAAIRGHCDVLYSEDFAAGRQYGKLTIRNPFESPETGGGPLSPPESS